MNAEPLPLILVVDDNATDVYFLQQRLAAAGIVHPIHHCHDGADATGWLERAFDAAAGDHPRLHVVFLDLNMPRMDGFAVLEWLRQRDITDRLTVAVLTTSDEPQDMERAKRLGAHAYLVKYPKIEDLQRVHALATQRSGVNVS